MQVVKIQQNSEEWFEFRKGKITGSKLSNVYSRKKLTIAKVKTFLEDKKQEAITNKDIGYLKAQEPKKDEFYKLVAEKIARPITPNDYLDDLNGQTFNMMNRGHILEPQAIVAFEKKTKKKVDTGDVLWVSDENPSIMISPDGSIKNKAGKYTEAVEIKCPDTHKIIRAYHENNYPEEYHEQVVQYFLVNEDLEKLYFVLYTDVMPALPIIIFGVNRKDVIDEIEQLKVFEEEILKQVDKLTEELAF